VSENRQVSGGDGELFAQDDSAKKTVPWGCNSKSRPALLLNQGKKGGKKERAQERIPRIIRESPERKWRLCWKVPGDLDTNMGKKKLRTKNVTLSS